MAAKADVLNDKHGQMKVILLCDDSDDALIFKDTIREIDTEISCVIISSTTDDLSTLRSASQPDAIFLDLNSVPTKLVRTLLKAIGADNSWQELKLIIYSDSQELTARVEEELRRIGANGFVTKTSDLALLRHSISQILKGKQ